MTRKIYIDGKNWTADLDVEFEEKDASFDHLFGTQKRTRLCVVYVSGSVTFYNMQYETISVIDVENVDKSVADYIAEYLASEEELVA